MTSKSDQILDAAFEVFTRFGLQKTTMADIARSAGVSRQTLYNIYDKKENVIEGVVRKIANSSRLEIVALWKEADSFAEILDIFCQHGPLQHYDRAHALPHAEEFIVHASAQCGSTFAECFEIWKGQMMDQISRFYPDFPPDDLPDFADFAFSSIMNTKHNLPHTPDGGRSGLEARLRYQKLAILAFLEAGSTEG